MSDNIVSIANHQSYVKARSTNILHDNLHSLSFKNSQHSVSSDFLFISLVKRLLFPLVAVIYLCFLVIKDNESFSNSYFLFSIFVFLLSIQIFNKISFYRTSTKFPIFSATNYVFTRWIVVICILISLGYITGINSYFSEKILLTWMIFTPFLLLAFHIFSWKIIPYIVKNQSSRTAIIVGANQLGYNLFQKICADKFLNIKVQGFFDDRDISRLKLISSSQKLGSINELPEFVKKNQVQIAYICLPIGWQPRINKLLDDLRDTTLSIHFVPDIVMFEPVQHRIDQIAGFPLITIRDTPFYGFKKLIKTITDITIAGMVFPLILPIMLIIAVGIKLTSPGPIIFKQRRYGLDGKEIIIYKFRTMHVCEDSGTIIQAKPADKRITSFGLFLRKTSLDELPQFLNVLEGKMSIVGPRPHAVAHNEIYRKLIKGYMIRHKVKPGITGWAQINGFRGETSSLDKMTARVEYDIDYLRHWSLTLDLKIIFKTIFLIFGDQKAY